MVKRWLEVLRTCNLPEGLKMHEADFISKWLVISRACVLSMTLISGVIGGLLALTQGPVNWWLWIVAVVGIVLAHASNNMINDYLDYRSGADVSEDYPRGAYSPQPLHSGWVTRTRLMAAILLVNLIDLVIAVYLAIVVGWEILIVAVLGLFISVFYMAEPINLKRRGLGELGVFLVWGPLMIGGVYFAVTGAFPAWVTAASVPCGITVTTVLMGKHIDKIKPDTEHEVKTLPVRLGEEKALFLNQVLFVSFLVIVALLVLTGTLGLWVLLTLLAIPKLVRETWPRYSEPKPAEPPENFPIWPLWYTPWAFRYNRTAGGLFVLGLIVNLIIPL